MVRLFKPGDRVQLKSGGPVMIVQKYAREHHPWIGWHISKYAVECAWYDAEEGKKTGIFHQNNLVKTSSLHDLKIFNLPAEWKRAVQNQTRN